MTHLWEAKIQVTLTWNRSAIAPGNGVVGIEFGTIFEVAYGMQFHQ